RNQNLGIASPNHTRTGVGEIDAGVGDADIVQHRLQLFLRNLAAQHPLHFITQTRGLFYAQTGPGTKVETDQAGIHLRKEIPPQKEHQPQRQEAESRKTETESFPVFECGFQQLPVAAAESFKPALESALPFSYKASWL